MIPLKPYRCDAHEFADSEIGIGGPAALVCDVLLCFALQCTGLLCLLEFVFLASVMACSSWWLRCSRLRSHEQQTTEPSCAALVCFVYFKQAMQHCTESMFEQSPQASSSVSDRSNAWIIDMKFSRTISERRCYLSGIAQRPRASSLVRCAFGRSLTWPANNT